MSGLEGMTTEQDNMTSVEVSEHLLHLSKGLGMGIEISDAVFDLSEEENITVTESNDRVVDGLVAKGAMNKPAADMAKGIVEIVRSLPCDNLSDDELEQRARDFVSTGYFLAAQIQAWVVRNGEAKAS